MAISTGIAGQRRAGADRGLARPSRLAYLATVLLLVLTAALAHGVRRSYLRAFFPDGAPGPAPALPVAPGEPLRRAERVRVVILDGLSLATARSLPTLSRLCGRGLDLVVDMGFPTVSLPIQHALYTGLTQQQSGVQYRVAPLVPPLAQSLPGLVPDSVGVAESHQEILHSFAFARVLPARERRIDDGWRAEFPNAARHLATSDSRLAVIHILRIDEAGHRHGADSVEYRRAAAEADAWLAGLVDSSPRADTAWLFLADHGHIAVGGHADAEDVVRKVRACLIRSSGEALGRSSPAGRELHLVDLSRALFELSGVPLPAGALGRPLAAALAAPLPLATLPVPSSGRWGLALVVLLAGAALAVRGRGAGLWFAVSYLAIVALYGVPTLSCRAVYSSKSWPVALAALPGVLLLLGALVFRVRIRKPAARPHGVVPVLVLGQLALPTAITAASLILCGEAARLLSLSKTPPLMPLWSGHASIFLLVLSSGAAAAALLLAVLAVAPAGRAAVDPAASDRS